MIRRLKIKLLMLAMLPVLGFSHPAAASEGSPASLEGGSPASKRGSSASERGSSASEKGSPATAKQSAQTSRSASKLADGLYLVLRSSHEQKSIEPLGETEKLLPNDFHLLEPAERESVVYLVLQTKAFVPLILGSNPSEDTEEATGKPRLQLQLAEDQKGPLEEFTRAHLGETVAIVIGGDVVTTHKVKSAVTGGRLQITRCTKHGCETLYTNLLKNHPKS
jgi:hypothetical protein